MKKLFIPFLLLLMVCSPLFAQTTSDFYVSYGILSVPDFAELGKGIGASIGSAIGSGIVDALFGPGSGDPLESTDISGYGPITIGYNFYPGKHIRLGILAAYNHYDVVYTSESGKTATDKDNWITAMARLDLNWIHTSGFMMYSGVAAGASYYHSEGTSSETPDISTDSDWFFAFQVNLLGFRIGSTVGFFMEFGVGFNGLIDAGLSIKL